MMNIATDLRAMSPTARARRPVAQAGFTLLEVLIAVVILSVGLLGLAALQATSLRANQDALVRSQMSILSYDMIDRMRANMPGVTVGAYNLPTATQTGNCTTNTGCTVNEMAEHDFFEWRQLITSIFPGSEGVVCLEGTDGSVTDGTAAASHGCGGGTEFVIKLWWDEDRDGTLDTPPFTVSFQP